VEDGIFTFLMVVLFFIVMKQEWYVSALSISLLIYSLLFHKKTSYGQMMVFSMIGAIVLGFFLFNFFLYNYIKHANFLAISTLVFMCFLSIRGIFEDDLEKYLLISNFIQVLFIFLGLILSSIGGRLLPLGLTQTFNYTIGGTLLFLCIGVLSKDNRRVKLSQLRGSIYRNPLVTASAILTILSLSGFPGLNMFPDRWLLIQKYYLISPIIPIFLIFLTLLNFVMYSKLIYVLSSGESKIKEKIPIILGLLIIALLVISILLGIPNTQYYIMEVFV